MSPEVVEIGVLDSDTAVAETDPVPMRLLVSLASSEVGLEVKAVEFVSGEEVIPVSVALVWTDVGVDTGSVLEADVLAKLDWPLVVLAVGVDVFVYGYVAVSLALELLTGPVDNGIDGDVDPSTEEGPAGLVGRLLVGPAVRADEFVNGDTVVSVALRESSVVRLDTDEPVNDGSVENPVLGKLLDSDTAVPEVPEVPEVVLFIASVADMGVPWVVKFSVRVGDDEILLGA